MNTNNNRWFSLIVLLTAPLLSVIDAFIINMAIPSIKKGIGASNAELQLVIVGYLLGFAGFLITGGRAGDFFGRKKIFIYGMLFFTIMSCLCGLSQTPMQLNITRFFQGVSAAFMAPQTISYIQVLFPEAIQRTKALGFYGLTISIAAISGQLLGGFLPGYEGFIEGWRLIFFINLPIGLIALIFAYLSLKETEINKNQKFDFSGVFILTIALIMLIYPLIQGRELGWPLWSILAVLFSFFLFWYFIKDQNAKLHKGANPLINTKLFRFKDFNIGILALSFYFMVHTSFLLVFTIYLQDGLGMTPDQAGLTFVFMGVGSAISAVLSVKVYMRYGKKILQFGTLLMISAFVIEFFLFNSEAEWFLIAATLLIQGLGIGIIVPSLLNITLKSIPVQYAGTAAGVYNTIQQTASALGVSIIGGIFYHFIDPSIHLSFYTAFRYSVIVEIFSLMMVVYLLYLIPEKTKISVPILVAE